ncbi:hypothetical protein AO356_03675 [Pseudomonas fluorescens]|uniref:Uncharacterized protein n=1 Tax=Pseudomonas fluorescens TaxID=294 RepID=A0A0N9WDI5_PSEFL|nr:hypothetical protein AO356_03675 [Pseudomonas fluorescens]
MNTRKTCGSELARDDGRTFNIAVDGHTAIASKLAPTRGLRQNAGKMLGPASQASGSKLPRRLAGTISVNARKTCGSELARDDGFTSDIAVDGHTAIASKLAPTWGLRQSKGKMLGPASQASGSKLPRRLAGTISVNARKTCGSRACSR